MYRLQKQQCWKGTHDVEDTFPIPALKHRDRGTRCYTDTVSQTSHTGETFTFQPEWLHWIFRFVVGLNFHCVTCELLFNPWCPVSSVYVKAKNSEGLLLNPGGNGRVHGIFPAYQRWASICRWSGSQYHGEWLLCAVFKWEGGIWEHSCVAKLTMYNNPT